MKRLMATWLLGALFTTAFVAGKGTPAAPAYPDSLPSVWFYTEGIKQQTITGDTLRARKLFAEAIRRDSNYAPAYFELVSNGMYASPEEAVELAGRAYRLDTANKWYHQFYGQTLVFAGEYDRAVPVYRSLIDRFPKEPDFYRILAALYEQTRQPAEAVALLDSAEMRFGRIPVLNSMKRRLLVATGQIGRALDEARQEAAATPYEPEPHVALANLYAADGRDSLARAEFDEALRIDSTNLATLMSLADYYTSRQDYRSLLAVSRRLFLADELPLETKIRQFEQYTSDIRFYREYYLQLNDLASVLAIKYPDDKRVVELYAGHLIASGELDQALALYKSHLDDQPPVEEYYRTIIDIESYKKRTDSVGRYVVKAIGLFPDRIDFRLAKGHVASLSGDYDRALGAYEESLAYASTDSLRSVVWGMTRRHVAPEGHRRCHRLGRADGPRDGQAHGRIPQGDETLLQRLRAQPALRPRQHDGTEQLRLFPLGRGTRSGAGAGHGQPCRGARGRQPDLPRHPRLGAPQTGTHGRSQEDPAAGGGARRAEIAFAAGPLRRHAPCLGRTVHGRNLLASGAGEGIRSRIDRTPAQTAGR